MNNRTTARTQGWKITVAALAAALAINAAFGYLLGVAGTQGQRYLAERMRDVDCRVAYVRALPLLPAAADRLREPAT